MNKWYKVIGMGVLVVVVVASLVWLTTSTCRPNPDGRRIAFSSNRAGGSHEIYVMNADGTCVTQLTDTMPDALRPRWSPDGTRILFQTENTHRVLYVMDADGSNQMRLADCGEKCRPRALWSPDGSQIVFMGGNDLTHCTLYIISADGARQRVLVDMPLNSVKNGGLRWSPDGTQIGFSTRDPETEQREVYVVNADGSGLTNLTNHDAMDDFVAWTPNGRRILFVSDRDVAPRYMNRRTLYIMDVDGMNTQRLIDNVTYKPSSGIWVPYSDSQIVVDVTSVDYEGSVGCYVVDIACVLANRAEPGVLPSECALQLPRPDAPELISIWPPGGAQYAYTAIDYDTLTLDIFVVNFDGTGLTNLTNHPAEDIYPDWSP